MTSSINSVSQRKLDLATAATAQAPQKPAIDPGAELHVKGLRELVAEKISEKQPPSAQETPKEKQTKISLKDKVVCIQFIGVNGTGIEDEIELKTTHWVIAAIMNLFAKIFPCCVQGAAKFSFDNQTCYVRKAVIQEKIHMQIQRHEFKNDPQANTLKLKVLSSAHFQSEE
jgi:hypothetical protein